MRHFSSAAKNLLAIFVRRPSFYFDVFTSVLRSFASAVSDLSPSGQPKEFKMLMPKSQIRDIYEYLFMEGVLVAKKDVHLAKHPLIPSIPNLHVMKCLNSLKSRGYVKEQFAWRHLYWYLTNEGIEFIRDYLNLPEEIVPNTMKPKQRAETQRAKPLARPDYRSDQGGDRDVYRKAAEKKGDLGLGPNQDIEFRGGFQGYGRGQPRQ
ncbi:putative 40S ribosomal protein S10 [Hypsibius exemplaris]|uniref:40S ribosomal protein S10 n=1 Tax=Hypsibius exemplaris TaxID=2072580 RepID=A0A1W0WVV9_HYPEX|nr:putative 40S ribosomal protein S10 [Hypsibius exemplaris]